MVDRYILDTGFIVALSDPDDATSEACAAVWRERRGEIHSVEGVLVEAIWLLWHVPNGPRTALNLVESVATRWSLPSARRYARAVELMDRYRNVPMDFVDAMLVALAEEQGIEHVLTLDRRGFEIYRFGRNRHFKILP